MTFDTTASNTGHVSAAYVTIQRQLQRALLWSGCRHHIGEVLLTHVFNNLKIDMSKWPDTTLFTRFRKNFDRLPQNTDQPLADLDLTLFPGPAQKLLEDCRATVIQLAKSELELDETSTSSSSSAACCSLMMNPVHPQHRLSSSSDQVHYIRPDGWQSYCIQLRSVYSNSRFSCYPLAYLLHINKSQKWETWSCFLPLFTVLGGWLVIRQKMLHGTTWAVWPSASVQGS